MAMSRVVSWKMQHVLTNVHTYVCAYVPGRVCDAIQKTRPRATGTRVATWPYIKFACTHLNKEKRVNYEINFKII